MSKLNRNESITTNTMAKICAVLNCRVEDVMEFVPKEDKTDDEAVAACARLV